MKPYDLSLMCILLLALGGGLLILFASPWGIGLSTDSIQYIQAARNLLSGAGLAMWGEQGYQPLTHFPPLYSLLLASVGSSISGILSGARGIQAILFAANIASVGLIVRMCSPRAHWLGVLAAGVACCALPLLEIHAWAWSEPLFILLSMWGLFLLYRHLEGASFVWLLGAAGLVALACLMRYAGLAVALAGAICILLLSWKPWRYRITGCLTFTLLSLLPVSAWLALSALGGMNSIDRPLALHPLSLAQVKTAVVVVTTWLAPMPLPNSIRMWLAITLSGVLCFGAYKLWRRKKNPNDLRPLAYILIFIISYSLVLGISLSYFDSSTPINNRILSPVFTACLFLAACLAGAVFSPLSNRQKLVTLLCFFTIIGVHLHQGAAWLSEWRRQGLGYASAAWVHSEVLGKLRSTVPGTPIYSNEPEAIYLYTGQNVLPLPDRYNPYSLLGNGAFNTEMQHMGAKMRDNHGILVIFRTNSWRPYQPTEADILELLPLIPSVSGNDGLIYTWKDGS